MFDVILLREKKQYDQINSNMFNIYLAWHRHLVNSLSLPIRNDRTTCQHKSMFDYKTCQVKSFIISQWI